MRPTTLPWLALTALTIAACGGDTITDTSLDSDTTTTGTGTATGTASGTATGSTTTDCTAGGISIEIGAGEFAYEPLSEGDEVLIIKGGQGGWHIDTAAVVTGSAGVVTTAPVIIWHSPSGDIQIAGGDQPATGVALDNYDADTCSGDVYGQRAFVDDYLPPNTYQEWICSLNGQGLMIEMTVTDITTYAETVQTLEVTARPDPASNPAC